MASFSRGLLVLPAPCRRAVLGPRTDALHELHLLHRRYLTPPAASPSRLFTSSARALRTSPAPPKPRKPAGQQQQHAPSSRAPTSPSPTSSPSPSSSPSSPSSGAAAAGPAPSVAPSRYAFIKSLASKQTPTLLYEAPSHFWFYFGCWSSGLSIVAWTALTGPSVVHQPEGVPQWVGITFGASYVLLGAMGFYLLSKTPNIVSSIRVLPPPPPAAVATAASGGASSSAAAVAGRRVAAAATTTSATSATSSVSASASAASVGPQIEVTVKRMVPLLAPKVVIAPLDRVSLKSRFSLPDEYVPELRRRREDDEARRRRERLWRFDMEHLLTMPFRRLGRAFANMFRGVRAAWTDMGFGVITVDGKDYKVDVTKGFAHDGFRTLERIVPVGPK
ncbi:ribosome-interacting GTPase 1 [Purpureocillium lavendulum]|uniref:Ribosome-interacting GTPase 1 n=1 Tax=Purpureocillium lavendulum TaxID=1247861 RepID=A0AB34G755_9HYPO|nr:ribosome-interacting GTPase 1 [Purpureocillium lavendulum]